MGGSPGPLPGLRLTSLGRRRRARLAALAEQPRQERAALVLPRLADTGRQLACTRLPQEVRVPLPRVIEMPFGSVHDASFHAYRTGERPAIFPPADDSAYIHAMRLTSLPDADLVARCRAGDQDAWRELVNRFSRYVYAICSQAFRLRQDDCEEVFQEVFSRTYEHLDRLRDDAAIRPWIGQLTRRLSIDRLRSSSREEFLGDEPAPAGEDETMDRLDEAFWVHEAMAGLPENCREILDRFFARDESYQTIGAALDIPSGTIASRISRCLGKLREILEGRELGSSPSS